MKLPAASTLASLLLLSPVAGASEAPGPEPAAKPIPTSLNRPAVDGLSDAELEQVLQLLKENFINPKALKDEEMRRATVQGVLDRISPGAAILQVATGE